MKVCERLVTEFAERFVPLTPGGCKRVIEENVNSDVVSSEQYEYKIRKLTPTECFRLMGFTDLDFFAAKLGSREKAKEFLKKYPVSSKERYTVAESRKAISNSQLYKMAGNSIVVNVLYHIYKSLYDAMPYLFDDLTVGSFFSGIGAFEKGLDMLYEGKTD